MKYSLVCITLAAILLFAYSAAAEKVVVVPLFGGPKPSGDAAPADVLDGKTFSNDSGPAIGTMPDQADVILTPGSTNVKIPSGYHDGNGYVEGDADLSGENIIFSREIFGTMGSAVMFWGCRGGLWNDVYCYNDCLAALDVEDAPECFTVCANRAWGTEELTLCLTCFHAGKCL